MKHHVLLLVPMFLLTGCTATQLHLPTDPVQLTIIQRHAKSIPGSNNTVRIQLDDITADQVLLSIRASTNRPIVDTRSVKEGDVIPFDLKRARYFLRVVELKNLLIGNDFGVFEVSTAQPRRPLRHILRKGRNN